VNKQHVLRQAGSLADVLRRTKNWFRSGSADVIGNELSIH